ncbi:hypothetical protein FEM48_Zijuj07G0051900 [Ziziphus jujuba var. spinosa]|uniref:Protein RALF-like 24 n=1 Tax=Ziziphus jujuba var. spinosa TaxID=714518 RepID=A0A978V2N2_ZIZJJ|nr:hypothetical protein FEM48_Zijuj07G0051900 [Ziziphus jujuba var. spinosa]
MVHMTMQVKSSTKLQEKAIVIREGKAKRMMLQPPSNFREKYLPGVSVLDLKSLKNSEVDMMVGGGRGGGVCNQKVEKCLTEVEEMMDSETNRRILAMQKRFISYETLRRDMIPCATPGAPYYNCHPGAANPYNRGCEVITRCARDLGLCFTLPPQYLNAATLVEKFHLSVCNSLYEMRMQHK